LHSLFPAQEPESCDPHNVPYQPYQVQSNAVFHENVHTQPAASSHVIPAPKPFLCAQCPAAYRRLGDLSRHQKEKHSAASSKFLCPIEKCPRGIAGEGFGRNSHLVNHLKSSKHGMDAREAEHLARQHNKPKAKAMAIHAGNEGGAGDEAGVNAL
jgi:uncharacterized Zn-finger protein